MQVEEAVFKILRDDTDVADIVDDRIYPIILDTDVLYPALAYRLVSGDHTGSLGGSSGLKRERIRIFSTDRKSASGYKVAKRLGELVRLALQDFRGEVFSDVDPSSIFIQDIIPASAYDWYDDKTKTFQHIEDFDIWVHETQPEHV